jgi:hypothetical protein
MTKRREGQKVKYNNEVKHEKDFDDDEMDEREDDVGIETWRR